MTVFFQLGRDDDAEALVLRHHYSGRWPTNVRRSATVHRPGGLFGDMGDPVAACVFSVPPTRWSEPVIELIRLVREPTYRGPLTALIAYGCKALRQRGYDLCVSFADKAAGHYGGVYQAASWSYHGERERAVDGLVINGLFVAGRTCNSLYGTRSAEKLQQQKPGWLVERHYDDGKYLYWRALNRAGAKKARRLELHSGSYPKPSGKDSKK